MKCFYHAETDAVAICKSCSRAICHDCCADVGTGCACRGRCEDDVAAINEILQRGRTAYQKSSATFFRTALLTSAMGITFVALGSRALSWSRDHTAAYAIIFLGVLFVVWGISYYVSSRRLREK
jgi:hypothetical protein